MRPIIVYIYMYINSIILWAFWFMFSFVVELNMNFKFCTWPKASSKFYAERRCLLFNFALLFNQISRVVNNIRFLLSMSVIVGCWPEVIIWREGGIIQLTAINSDVIPSLATTSPEHMLTILTFYIILMFDWRSLSKLLYEMWIVMQTNIKTNTYHFAGSK